MTPTMITARQDADEAITALEQAAQDLADARGHEQGLEDERPLVKAAAIARMVGTENPLNGKPHSASSAEAVVEQDAAYAEHRRQQRNAVRATQLAWGQYEAAKRRADLAIETFKLIGEV